MKKIINGKMYNTGTASEVGTWWNGLTGFENCRETLYRKKTGEYFLYGEGGPMSRYAVHHGNSSSDGYEFKLITKEEAMKWAEENLTADEYIEEFGEVEE